MAAFVIFEKKEAGATKDVQFLRDGFRWLAFVVPTVWLLVHRLWFEAAIGVALTVLVSVLGELNGMGGYASVLTFLISLYFGLEASELQRRALARRGWREWGVIDAPRQADAELIYAARAGDVETSTQTAAVPAYNAIRVQSKPVAASIGLVPYPGR